MVYQALHFYTACLKIKLDLFGIAFPVIFCDPFLITRNKSNKSKAG